MNPRRVLRALRGGALTRRAMRWRFEFRERLSLRVTVPDGSLSYAFRCDSFTEYTRARTLFSKEPGTVRWIHGEVRPGDVFYDIGANIGVYTIPAAHRVGDEGRVYAFEPHAVNVKSLLRNVRENGLDAKVTVLSCPLHNAVGFFEFNYNDWTPGSSMSQLEGDLDTLGKPIRPAGTEVKYASTIDELIEQGVIEPPSLVKIDVDGNELQICQGMRRLLTGEAPPRAVQAEVNPDESEDLHGFLESCGFEMTDRHYTGDDPSDPQVVHYNAIFRPAGRTAARVKSA